MSSPRAGRFGNALGFLAAEFVVIVIGVLVALGVDEYAAARDDHERVAFRLQQLELELAEMKEALVVETGKYEAAEQAGRSLVKSLASDQPLPTDSLVVWFPGMFAGMVWEPEATVINTMISSGDIALVADQSLQAELVRFRERIQTANRLRSLAEGVVMTGWASITESGDLLRWAPEVFGIPSTGQTWDWERIAADIRFRNGVYQMANGVRNHRIALNWLAGDMDLLQAALDRHRELE